MSDSYSCINLEQQGPLATVTINRPDKLNALNSTVIRELISAFHKLSLADEAERPKTVILTGAGDKSFVAGADIAEMSSMTSAQALAFASQGHRLGSILERAPFPIIAAVNGFALGGGCELALACDFIYASDKAKFSQPEVNLGVIPGFGGTQRLSRRVGVNWARELVLTGDMLTAEDALRIGLVNRVFPHAELLARCQETAAKIASKGPLAIAAAKRVINLGADAPLATANELEASEFAVLFGSEDQKEGMTAFLEKRKPRFQNK